MSRSGGYKCYNMSCNSCIGRTLCGEPGDVALNCVDRIFSQKTNADRIRSMSDEELAEWLEYPICKYSKCAEVCPVFPENKDKSCKENILNYLRQPAEEG